MTAKKGAPEPTRQAKEERPGLLRGVSLIGRLGCRANCASKTNGRSVTQIAMRSLMSRTAVSPCVSLL